MEFLIIVKAAILGIVEGLTEFLPISSTGHLIVASSLLNFTGEKVPTFEIAIQTGAMFAVIWEYRTKLSATVAGIFRERIAQRFAINVAIAFAPAVVFGLALGGLIKAQLFHPVPVALAFIIGGFIILWVERRHHRAFGERDLQVPAYHFRSVEICRAYSLKSCSCMCRMIPGTAVGPTITRILSAGAQGSTEFHFYRPSRR